MRKIFILGLFGFLIFCLVSCFSFKQNNEYAQDFNSMDKNEFSKKYFTLYNDKPIDFSKIKKDKAYYILRNNSTFQIIVFSEDKFIYESQLIPLPMLNKPLPVMKLGRSSYFSIAGKVFKAESMAASPGSVYSVIEEGEIIGEDTIRMKKSYNAKGYKNEHNLFDEYIIIQNVRVYKMGKDYFVESK